MHQVRVEVFGEQNPQGMAWVEETLHKAKHEGYESFWEELSALRAKTPSPAKREAIDGLTV